MVLLAASLARPSLAADATASDSAEALFKSAREALKRGDLATACVEFAESQRLDPAPGTLLNLAECEERSGKFSKALSHFEEAHAHMPAGDSRQAFAQRKLAELTKRVGRLVLTFSGPLVEGMRITCDDIDVGATSLGTPKPMDPGVHVCVVRVPGHADLRTEVSLTEGGSRAVELSPGPPIGHEAPPPPVAPSAPPPAASPVDLPQTAVVEPKGSVQRVIGFVVGGAGVAALGTGTAFWLVAKGTYSGALKHCPTGPSSCDRQGVQEGHTAHVQADLATGALIAAGALLGVGGALVLTAPREGKMSVAPTIGSGRAGLALSGEF